MLKIPMKKLILSLSVVLVAMAASVQAGDAKGCKDAKAPCCDKAKSGTAAKSSCSKDAQAKKMDLSQKGGSLLITSL